MRALSLDHFVAEAARTEASLAAAHDLIARRLLGLGHPQAGAVARIAEEEAAAARTLADGAPLPDPAPDEASLPDAAAALLNLAIERLERAAEDYLAVAETSRREEVVGEVQRLAEAAVRRLAATSR